MSQAVLWFRNDLRLCDNEPLCAVLDAHEACIPVYVFDERLFKTTDVGLQKTGAYRAQFMLESVQDLRDQLRALGSDLVVRMGKPERVVAELATDINARAVYASNEYGIEEWELESQLGKNLGAIPLHLFHMAPLIHPVDLPFELDSLPDVFTVFWKKVEKYSDVRAEFPAPQKLPAVDESIERGGLPSLEALGMKAVTRDSRAAITFNGGEREGLKRLHHYLWGSSAIATYKETRNGMIGADYSSKFSAWLAHGCLSAKSIYYEVIRFEKEVKKNQSTYWMLFELLWRDYFKFVMMKFGQQLFHQHGIKGGADIPAGAMHQNRKEFDRWALGETGEDFVDANMRELNATGFMSNRGRQNVASYLVKDLQVDWRMGASYFESLLIDYDVCSNYGNWQYVAGVGNDPREDRYFNVKKQAERYDPHGDFQRLWLEKR